ncbi:MULTISPECIES: sodium/proline symporter [unclassified Bacillus (in: firmicutes)]|uniref:sodium/proline symporter n=1 Tax=unclassified Bacillus (in: firmicutes) TaxID=185979 RepID=UPI000BF7B358|nr:MULTISPECIES: sodium/proline symporter [unclassified Bacillus (in: firmicutes)]PFG12297.1 SSS family solute:Na+ symporter/sodium/proline symporter [Bacillus sp. es.036]
MITTFIIYLIIVFVIGVAAERFISKSEEGYYLGDRSFGPVATAISAGSTDTSGWIFIGAAGYSYSAGISTMWMLPGFIVGYLLNWFIVAPRLRKATEENNSLSLADYFEKRFNDKSHLLKVTTSIIIVLFFVAYMASQLTAAGKALDAIVSLDFSLGLILCAAFVIGYAIFGGYRSVVWTDVVQGFIMIGVLVLFPAYMIVQLGGWNQFFQQIGSIDPILLSSGGGSTGAAAFGVIMGLVVFGLGGPGQPHIVQRFLSAKDDQTIRQGSMIAMIWVIIVMTGSNLLGLIGRIVIPNLDDAEYVFPQMTAELMPPILAGIVLGAIFAAIQSTFSSQVMVATQAIASDILKSFKKKQLTDSQYLMISRLTMVGLGIVATSIALLNIEAVFTLVLYAWAGLAAAFGPLLILSLYYENVTKWGAFTGMLTGAVVTIVWKNTPYSAYLYELIPGALASIAAILIISKFTKVNLKLSKEEFKNVN